MPTATRRALSAATAERLGLGRTGVGVVMALRPALVPRLLGVDPGASAATAFVVQMLGAREVALGLGSVAAVRSGDRRVARTWLVAGLLCDAVDAVAVAGALGRGRVRGAAAVGTIAVAVAAVAVAAGELSRR